MVLNNLYRNNLYRKIGKYEPAGIHRISARVYQASKILAYLSLVSGAAISVIGVTSRNDDIAHVGYNIALASWAYIMGSKGAELQFDKLLPHEIDGVIKGAAELKSESKTIENKLKE